VTRVAIVVFPGSNCEYDAALAMREFGVESTIVFHRATDLGDADAVILPGGFAHGDYLRPGALARFSPVMEPVARFAAAGGPVLGICNGFQVLTEAGLLPGALQKNRGLTFLSEPTTVVVASTRSVLTRAAALGQELVIPINHFSGAYTCDDETYRELVANDQIVLRYRDNPNGSRDDVAGITNVAGNVVGLMPHPERAVSARRGSADGRGLHGGFVAAPARRNRPGARARDPGPGVHVGGHAGLAERAVADAVALGVGLGDLDELLLETRHVDARREPDALGVEVEALLGQLEALDGCRRGQGLVDAGDLHADGLGRALAPALALTGGHRVEVTANDARLVATLGQFCLMVGAHCAWGCLLRGRLLRRRGHDAPVRSR
jgi:phosphoribosylformylglycinamidine synthase